MSCIVVFDSGVGGLSVYQEIIKKCPNHHYVFVSDNKAFPYGTKSEEELIERVLTVVQSIDRCYKPDLLVVACNTASTIALPSLRDNFNFPIVGVVPAIKPAAIASKTKTIGLLATPGTIARNYTQNLIDEFANDCTVIKVGSSELVEIAEQKIYGNSINIKKIEKELAPFFNIDELDTLVLACTHFPLLNNEMADIFKLRNHSVVFVDSGVAIANRVFELCLNLTPSKHNSSSVAAFTRENFSEELITYLQGIGINNTEILRE